MAGGSGKMRRESDFRVEVEKGGQARFELLFDIFLAALENVHGDVRLVAVAKLDGSVAEFGDFVGGEQTQAVHQCQICHA